MMCIDCDTEMTGKPVCRATRSAVRCRVPVSWVTMVASGIRWTAGPDDAGGVTVADDRAVHLGELAQAGRGELDVEEEAAGRDRVDDLVLAEHDERAGATTQDALEALA